MTSLPDAPDTPPLASDFDRHSGAYVERTLFNHRLVVLALCVLATLILGWRALDIRLTASFEKMVPTGHPYIENYLRNREELKGLFPNAVRIAVAVKEGTILDAKYLAVLQRINDEAYLLPGVNRPFMKSLWTPGTRWLAVTEDGFDGGPVIPDNYDGSPGSLAQVRSNIELSGEIGQVVALDFKSSIVFVPLLETNSATGEPLDYEEFAQALERIRAKYEADGVQIRITGFAQVVGDLIQGLQKILAFFAIAIATTATIVYWYTRCVRSTLLLVACSLVAVIWQLGLLQLLHYELNPYAILVPFLVFAIGMSHGAQKMNGIMQDIGRGAPPLIAARMTFRRLFLAGLVALLCDAVGFAVLAVVRIPVIQELAVVASVGVAVLIFTNLILLPILLSFVGVNPAAAQRSLKSERADMAGERRHPAFSTLVRFTQPRWAAAAVLVAVLAAVTGLIVAANIQIGDLDPGAPEFHSDSRYNRDSAFITANYGASSDVFAVMVKTPENACTAYAALSAVDALEWELRQVDGVESTASLAALSRQVNVGVNEGNPKWFELSRSQSVLNAVTLRAPPDYLNGKCSMLAVFAYLRDHRAETLSRVKQQADSFALRHNTPAAEFQLAAGSAGIEAVTNDVVRKANREMLLWVYGAVVVLCFVTFRSWRAVVCAIVPLVLTSILCEALMVGLNIGMKVATLPVLALGVGIGVDYSLYIMSTMLASLHAGKTLPEAYYRCLLFTGKVVVLTGITLGVAVFTWAFSPIKFQADMGTLLGFMFIGNMLGALVLVPALASLLGLGRSAAR